jgi:hypothetical protein
MVFLSQYHSSRAPDLYASTCCSHQKNKQAKPANLPKSSALSVIGEHGIEIQLHVFIVQELNTIDRQHKQQRNNLTL